MRVREFTSVVSSLSNWSMAHLDRITATLRAHEMLGTGGRGPHAPDITREQAARILIALGSEANPALAAEAVKTYSALEPVGPNFLWKRPFGDALAHLLGDPYVSLAVHYVTIDQATPPRSLITWKGLKGTIKETIYLPSGMDGSEGLCPSYRSVTYVGPMIHKLCNDLDDPHDRTVQVID